MMSELEIYINQCVQLPAEELREIEASFERKIVPKKTVLLQAGEVCKFEAFIVRGCVKTYFIDKKGLEIVLTFSTENWWVSDISSFENQEPTKMFIRTLEDTELLFLTPETKDKLLTNYPALERMFRLMVQRHLNSYQERLFGNIARTAQERYQNFLKKFPALPQRIPQHLIASYLGISPEFLSRLRKRKSKE